MRRDMKHIKLFEAFDSSLLSKTLNYIKSRDIFIRELRRISNKLDYPLSNFKDSDFKYLPFKQALDLGIGENIRELKYIKFWFSKDGDYITSTGFDGSYRRQLDSVDVDGEDYDISGYDIVKELTEDELFQLNTGDIVFIELDDYRSRKVVGTIFRERNNMYIIQNTCDGNEPNSYDWKKYGKYSWTISPGNSAYRGYAELLRKKDTDDKKIKNDFEYNNIINLSDLKMSSHNNVEHRLRDAHFALILDISNLTGDKLSSIKSKREISKNDAVAMTKAENIRNENIERYIDKLSKKFKASESLSGITKITQRIFGGRLSPFFILAGKNFSNYEKITSKIFNIMSTDDVDDIRDEQESVISILQSAYGEAADVSNRTNRTISKILVNSKNTHRKLILDEIIMLGEEINKKISTPVNTIVEMELLYRKLISIESFYKNRIRNRNNNGSLRLYIDYIPAGYSNLEYYPEMDKEDLDSAINLIRMLREYVRGI